MKRLAHIFSNIDMRCSHVGLKSILDKKKIKIQEGDYVVFMNGKRNIVKMFCGSQDVLLFYNKRDRIIDPGVIEHLPEYCGGNRIDMDGAVRAHLLKVLARKGRQSPKTLEKNPNARLRKKRPL